jgi:hypothetical protein
LNFANNQPGIFIVNRKKERKKKMVGTLGVGARCIDALLGCGIERTMPIVFEKPPHPLSFFRTPLTDRKHGPCGLFDEGVTRQAQKHNSPSSWTSNAPTTFVNMRYIYFDFEVVWVFIRGKSAIH